MRSLKNTWRLLVLLLAACRPVATTPYPTSVLWSVQYTPTLAWMGADLNACTQQLPGVALAVHELPASALDAKNADFSLLWGPPATTPGYTAVLGQDHLVFIVHPSNPAKGLSVDKLQAVYSGVQRTWDALIPQGSASPGEINVWEYPQGQDVQAVFEDLLGRSSEPEAFVSLAPYPAAMLQAVSEDPAAIGYIPARWLDSSVHALTLSGVAPSELGRPIVVLNPAEPQGRQREWLLCLQDRLNAPR